MIRVLADAPKLLGGKSPLVLTSPSASKTAEENGRNYNKNMADMVREYIDQVENEAVLSVKDIVAYLRTRGIKGKQTSLYSYDILKKESKKGVLDFEKGAGYSKRPRINTLESKLKGVRRPEAGL